MEMMLASRRLCIFARTSAVHIDGVGRVYRRDTFAQLLIDILSKTLGKRTASANVKRALSEARLKQQCKLCDMSLKLYES